ncbi:MAG: glycosyltransferase family 2 protein [Bryobacteraceae bacterium]
MSDSHRQLSYVLITPARNEAAFVEETLRSVVRQTILPLKWVIVDDGSTDATPQIVEKYRELHPWIQLISMPKRMDRSFAGKAYAFRAGMEQLSGLQYEVIANLDGDVSFDEGYFSFLLDKFAVDPTLGVAGTIFEEEGYSSATDSFEGRNHVPGQCQLFRRACFEEIGGYTPHRAGGIDWIAVTTARMMGWRTESFREKSFFHYRRLGTAERSVLASLFSYGEKDYYLGGHPLWEVCRVLYRATKKPYVVGGIALYLGFLWAFLRRMKRPISDDLMRFHRQEQMAKLKAISRSMLRFKHVDNFDLVTR